jgi:putative phosphoesterase
MARTSKSRAAPVHTLEHHELLFAGADVIRIAVISDTHSKAHPSAASQVEASRPHFILHAGDIGNPDVLTAFESIAPTYVVRGNIDDRKIAPDVVTLTLRGEDGYQLRILMTHIALYGPRLRKDAKLLAHKHKPDLFVCGHSHVPFLAQEGSLVVFNPGSIGPRRFHLPICFGLLEFGRGHSKLRHVDCETGETWLPPSLGVATKER